MGNRNETSILISIGFLFLIPVVILYIYYMILQMYVLVYDLILNAIGLVISLIQFLLGSYTIINIISNDKKYKNINYK